MRAAFKLFAADCIAGIPRMSATSKVTKHVAVYATRAFFAIVGQLAIRIS